MKKPETIEHFITRMAGREFTTGDVHANCGVPPNEVRFELRPYVKAARVVNLGAATRDDTVTVWKATGL